MRDVWRRHTPDYRQAIIVAILTTAVIIELTVRQMLKATTTQLS